MQPLKMDLTRGEKRLEGAMSRPGRGHRKRQAAIAVVLSAVLVLVPGCWGKRELEDLGFVTMLGLDALSDAFGAPLHPAEEGLRISMGIAVPRMMLAGGSPGGGGGAGGGAPAMTYLSIDAPDPATAEETAESSIDRDLRMIHVQALVVGEDLAKIGLEAVMDRTSRFRDLRLTVPIVVTEGRASDLIKMLSASMESSPWTYVHNLIVHNANGLVSRQIRVHHVLMSRASKSKDAVVPLVRLTRETAVGPEGTAGGSSRNTATHFSVVLVGGAVFKDATMVGKLDVNEAVHALILQGALGKEAIMSYPVTPPPGAAANNAGTQYVTGIEWEGSKVKKRVSFRPGGDGAPGGVHIRARVELEGAILRLPAHIDITTREGIRNLESQVAEGVRFYLERAVRRAQQEFGGADIFFFGDLVRRRFLTLSEWEAFDWPTRFREATVELEIKVRLKRPGLTVHDVWNL